MTAIKAALDPSDSRSHLRVVCFMTDGYVGNENEIIAEIQIHPKARVFSFGIGSSVNRFLLDKMAEAGNGEVEYVALTDDGSKAAKRFHERVRTPLLTDLSIDWNGMPVADVYPSKLGDLFSAKPVIVNGRYKSAASGTVKLRGNLAGQPYEREIALNLPDADPANDVLTTLWARKRVDELSSEALKPEKATEVNKLISALGLEFKLLTQFTSFVAVEDRVVNQNGVPTRVEVRVALPEGVDAKMSGAYKRWAEKDVAHIISSPNKSRGAGTASGTGSGVGSGSGSGRGSAPPTVNSAVTATVEVTSGSSMIDMQETAITTTISGRTLGSLPVSSRSSSLMTLNSGIVGQYSTDGPSDSDNTFVIDGSEIASTGAGVKRTNTVSQGRAWVVAEPAYPSEARSQNVRGEVSVGITIDRRGRVVSAAAISGPSLLRAASESAARLSQFRPVLIDSLPVRLNGILVYKFTSADEVQVALRKMKAIPLTDSDKREMNLAAKMHSWVYDLVDRLTKGDSKPGPNEAYFVRGGKANLRVTVEKVTPELKARLASLGFEIVTEKGSVLVGRIASPKLAQLAELDEIRLILPDA